MGLQKVPLESLLMKQLQEGSEWAFRWIYHLYYKDVYLQALKILCDSEFSEDIAQDIFSKLWVQRKRIAGLEMETLKPYLLRAARNLSIDEKRRQKRCRVHYENYAYVNVFIEHTHVNLERKELMDQVDRALCCITSKRRRQIVECVYLKEENRRQVMIEMGITKNTIKEQLRRGIQILRDQEAVWKDYR